MKSVIIYLAGTMLLTPCIFVCSDSIAGAVLGVAWGVLMYHSPKFSPSMRKFWLEYHKIGLRMFNFKS